MPPHMVSGKPIATLSFDLDNLWSYLRGQGVADWDNFQTYLPTVVPYIVKACKSLGIRLTVFIVGRDAEVDANRDPIRALVAEGFDIGNHSYMHEPWMHSLSRAEISSEIVRAEEAIYLATGVVTNAFRGPGFGISKTLLEELRKRDYDYDASVFRTSIGPIIRWAYFHSAELDLEERRIRETQFGTIGDAFRTQRPFLWSLEGERFLELPVTTMPLFRTPIHFTYIHYLAQYSESLARGYLLSALWLCRLTQIAPSILLHPLDFLAEDDIPELRGFPGLGKDGVAKRSLTQNLLGLIDERFELKSLSEHAKDQLMIRGLPTIAV